MFLRQSKTNEQAYQIHKINIIRVQENATLRSAERGAKQRLKFIIIGVLQLELEHINTEQAKLFTQNTSLWEAQRAANVRNMNILKYIKKFIYRKKYINIKNVTMRSSKRDAEQPKSFFDSISLSAASFHIVICQCVSFSVHNDVVQNNMPQMSMRQMKWNIKKKTKTRKKLTKKEINVMKKGFSDAGHCA